MMNTHGCMGGFFFWNSILNEWNVGLVFFSTKVDHHNFKTLVVWSGVKNLWKVRVKGRHLNS
jgi:hypothetical protein